jgi:hypothetical protein
MSETTFADGSALVAASAPLPGSPAMAGAGVDGSLEVDVPAGATAIVVELAYTGLGPGFVLYVGDPADAWTEVHPDAASPGLQQLRVDGPEAGPWSALGFAESVAANAEFTLAFTVFYGEVPDGFSAFA